MYKYLRKAWKKPENIPGYKEKIIKWRSENVITKIENPTRLDKARALGYKSKQGFVLIRSRMRKGGRKRPKIRKGRVPKKMGHFFTTKQSMQGIIEKRVARRFPNLEVLNSYQIGHDGKYKYFEIILIDPNHPRIKKDKKYNFLQTAKGRAFRGKTSAGRQSRLVTTRA